MARRLILHPSLIRPNLLAGGDRSLTLLLWTCVFALIFGAGIRPMSIGVGMALGILGQMALIKAAKADPFWFEVYRRSLQYKKFYRAHSSVRAASARVRPSLVR